METPVLEKPKETRHRRFKWLNEEKKSEELNFSREIDVHTWSDYPEVNHIVDEIYETHFLGGNPKIQKKHIKVIILDLYVAWLSNPQLKIAYSRNHNDYVARTRYNELHISKLTIEITDTLEQAKLIWIEPGYHVRDGNAPEGYKNGRLARMWPDEKLIEYFNSLKMTFFDVWPHDDRLAVILSKPDTEARDEKRKIKIEYEPTPETERMEAMLKKYNDLIRVTLIDIPLNADGVVRPRRGKSKSMIVINAKPNFIKRSFTRGSFEYDGRFYGGWWQHCDKEERPKIFINDKPTNEIDFCGLHTVMLYAEEGLNYWEVVGEDPYKIPKVDFLKTDEYSRKIAKSLMFMAINAEDEVAAYRAFRGRCETGTPEKKFTDKELRNVYQALREKHHRIAHRLNTDAGIKLMHKDSQITEFILEHFTNKEVPVLPVHDSYIIQDGFEDELTEVMCDAFERVMGVSLHDHRNLAMEEKSERVSVLHGRFMDSLINNPDSDQHHVNIKALGIRAGHPVQERYRKNLEIWNMMRLEVNHHEV